MDTDQLWKKITAAFFRKAETPASDEFVRRVMSRINDLEKAPLKEGAWDPWFVPSFGFGFAALLFVVTLSSGRPDLSAETLLMASSSTEVQWTFAEESQNDEVLGYTMEELR